MDLSTRLRLERRGARKFNKDFMMALMWKGTRSPLMNVSVFRTTEADCPELRLLNRQDMKRRLDIQFTAKMGVVEHQDGKHIC